MQSTATTTNGICNGAQGAPQALAGTLTGGTGRTLRIIVADDDPAMEQFYQEALLRLGHHVCMAQTGQQLVEQCRLLRPDLVIIGDSLLDQDDCAAIEEICRDRPIPILLVSADPNCGSSERVLDNPFVLACLLKPLKEADLRPPITLVLRRFEQFEALRKEAADLRQSLEDRKTIEQAKGMVMRYAGIEEKEAYRCLRKLASDQNRKLVDMAQAVLAAGELFQNLEQSSQGARVPKGGIRNPARR